MKLLPSKRRLKRIAIGLGVVVALLLIVNGLFAWWTERQWQNRLDAIRAAGDPASIADLTPKPIADELNAAVYIENIGPTLERFERAYAEFDNTDIGKSYEETRDRNELPTSEQSQAMAAILEAHIEIPKAVDAAVATGRYASRLDYSLGKNDFLEEMLDSPVQIRSVARYYGWLMRTLVAERRQEEAVQAGLKMLMLIRLYDSEPTIVNHLLANASREISIRGIDYALRAGPIAPEMRRALDDELILQDDPKVLVHALKTERALVSSIWDSDTQQMTPIVARSLGWPIKRYYIGVLDFYDNQLALAAEPWHEVEKQIGRDGASKTPTGFGFLADLLIPAIEAVYESSNRSGAMVRALRISNSLAAYREQHGRDASGLDKLPLLKDTTIDPFSGLPLKLKLTGNGWAIYTVFRNGMDDGGDFRDQKDYGLAPPGYQAK